MRRRSLLAILPLVSLGTLMALPKVAVLDIAAQTGIDAAVVVPITETIMEEVVGARAYVVLDRAYVEQVLKEMEFELSSLVGDTQATKAGQFLQADYVVAGKVQIIGDSYFVVAKMIEVRSGVIVAQASAEGEGKISALLGMSRQVGRKLVSGAPVSPLEPTPRPEPLAAGAVVQSPKTDGKRIKAGFVLPCDMKYTDYAVVSGLKRVMSKQTAWLDVAIAEKVETGTCAAAIDRLIEQDRCEILISGDWSFDEPFRRAAAKYPKVLFESAGGRWDEAGPPNLGVININEMYHYYLEGLVAGCLSTSGKVGVLAENLEGQPWARQVINTYALGAKAANPKAQLLVTFLPNNHWNNPSGDAAAAQALVAQGCDFLLGSIYFSIAESLKSSIMSGKKLRAFLRDESYKMAPYIIVSGPLRDFSVLYEKPLLDLKQGTWKRENYIPLEMAAFGGGEEAFNPAFLPELKAKNVKTPDRGTLALLDLIELRATQMRSGEFEPFTGPIKDQKGKVRVANGFRLDWKDIDAMDWFVDNVKLNPLKK